ncbi:hypothetical protein LTR62_006851 [Meristemomyces frigidus]|uniref:Uncharacterized protein n=1 Tax=Meristemomyces frigidus TaxID=1508187 RepID=A0AAN7TC65_9PEZI|nr:hypothetical protein LTR62_006851 [Meristemomyces frigidus]
MAGFNNMQGFNNFAAIDNFADINNMADLNNAADFNDMDGVGFTDHIFDINNNNKMDEGVIDPRLLMQGPTVGLYDSTGNQQDGEAWLLQSAFAPDIDSGPFVESQSSSLTENAKAPTSSYVNDIFGPGTGACLCDGSARAINELADDVQEYGLRVLPHAAYSIQDVVTVSSHHLEMLDLFPDVEQLLEDGQLTRDEINVNPFGIYATATASPYRDSHAKIPFENFSMLDALSALKDLAHHHDQQTAEEHEIMQTSNFQIGVITQTRGNGTPLYLVELFNNDMTKPITATIWLYRESSLGGALDGFGQEMWRPISDGTFELADIVSVADQPEFDNKKRASDQFSSDDESEGLVSAAHSAHDAKRVKHNQPSSTAATGPYPFDSPAANHLFATNPEAVMGPTILALARTYCNQEIFDLLNESLAAQGKEIINHVNVVTRRITLAILAAARRSGGLMTRKMVRADLNAAKKANGTKARLNVKTQAKKKWNRLVKEQKTGGKGLGVAGGFWG